MVVCAENTQSSAMVKPRRIVKGPEFVRQKGDQNYFFL